MKKWLAFVMLSLCAGGLSNLFAQNPIVRDQFSADPTARVFNGQIYVYPSHDIPTPAQKPGRKDWFCMEDYHVFSSKDLTAWKDHGVIASQYKVSWVDSASYSMWAPDCIEKNGRYYFYFPANVKPSVGKGFGIGVGISDKPEGPFVFQTLPIKNVDGIDPCVFIDSDGQAYLYWAQRGGLSMAKLNDNMLELASEPTVIEGLPNGFKEGPFLFERNGKYYLTFPYVKNKTEQLAYCVAESPTGPFRYQGVIMDESPTGCWTNHQSIVKYENQWYLFYHHNDYSPNFDKNRSVRIDSLFFNTNGSIRKVIPTFRGVGITPASSNIQPDRYSDISKKGVSVALIDSVNTFAGWKTMLSGTGCWVQYNRVDFRSGKFRTVTVRALSKTGGVLQIRLNNPKGPVIAVVEIPESKEWKTYKAPLSGSGRGIQDLVVTTANSNPVEVDWATFN
jgi:hypothetical protein